MICPGSLKIIGRRGFADSFLCTIVLTGPVEKVEDGAFFSCRNLEKPVFPAGTQIAENAFYYTPMCPHPYGEKPSGGSDD